MNAKKVFSILMALAMVLTFASFPAMAEPAANPKRVKIMTIGDSITQGTVNQNAYRYAIYENLIQDGAVFQFIGPFTSADFRVSATNKLYNGHGGMGGAVIGCANDYKWNGSSWVTSSWTMTDPLNGKTLTYSGTKNSVHYRLFAGSDGTNNIDKTEYGPYVKEADIVTILIGYNDYFGDVLSKDIEGSMSRYETIVDRIFEMNPDVSVYVIGLHAISSLKGHTAVEGTDEYIVQSYRGYNDRLEAFPEYYMEKNPGTKVSFISLDEANVVASVDTPVGDIHPNAIGDAKIGNIIYEGIKDEVLALNEQSSDEVYNPTRVTSVSLDKSSITLKKGENFTVASTIAPSDAEVITVLYSSSNESVATIDHYGRVTAVGAGTATIYATALDSLRPNSTEIKAAMSVTVTSDNFTKMGEDYLDVFVDNFLRPDRWTGNTSNISINVPAYSHPSSSSESSVTSVATVDLGTDFSMSFGVSVIGAEYKDVTDANRNNYYAFLKVGDYQLRVSINGKVVGFYLNGALKAEKVFNTPASKEADDRYSLVKMGDTVYVYRNNELLFTTTVDANSTAKGNVVVSSKSYVATSIREVVLKRGFDLDDSINLPKKLTISSAVYEGSSTSTHGTLEATYDGIITTGWGKITWSNATHSIKYDLGDVYDISSLRISWGANSANVVRSTDASVYVSTNGSSWQEIAKAGDPTFTVGSSWNNDGYLDEINLSAPVEARYIRIVSTKNGGNRGLGIREFEVYGYDDEATAVTYNVNCVLGGNTISTTTGTGYIGMTAQVKAPILSGYTAITKSETVFFVDDSTKTITFDYVLGGEPVPTAIKPVSGSAANGAGGGRVTETAITKIIDDNLTTFTQINPTDFNPANGPIAEYTFDFDDIYILQKMTTTWNANRPTAVDVYVSDDGVNWGAPAYTATNVTYETADSLHTMTVQFPDSTTGKHIKLVVNDAIRNGWCRIYDATFTALIGTDAPEIGTTYTVNYVDTEGNALAAPKEGTGIVGEKVTETAATVTGYTPDAESKTLTLIDGTNAITFVYTSDAEKVTLSLLSDYNSQPGHTADMVIDGDETTFYATNGYLSSVTNASSPYVLKFELSKTITLGSLELYWSGSGWGYMPAENYKVYVSEDNSNYAEILSYEGLISSSPTYDGKIVYGSQVSTGNYKARVTEEDLNIKNVRYIMVEIIGWKYRAALAEIYVTEGIASSPDAPEEPTTKPISIVPTAVSSTNNATDKPLALATDGNDETHYAANAYYNTITSTKIDLIFDIGYVGTLNSLDLTWGTSSWGLTTPDSYSISVSKDGNTWTQKKSYSNIYAITRGEATDNISSKNTTFGITTSQWAVDNNDSNVNAYTQGNILEKNLDWENVRYIKVTVTGYQYRLALREVKVSSAPNEDQQMLSRGGQIRFADTNKNRSSGIRFAASVIKSIVGIEGEYKYTANADVKFGMFMLPKSMLGTSKTLVDYIEAGGDMFADVPAKNIYSQDDNFVTFTAVLTDIPQDKYETNIVAVPYMLKDGEYTYFEEMIKSYKAVALSALETTYNPNAISAMEDSAEKSAMREISYQLQYIKRGYDKPYTEQGLRIVSKIGCGMNMQGLDASSWSSYDSHIKTVTSSSTYQNIKSAGFDHVRIPVDLRNATDSNGNIDVSKMTTYVDKAVDAAISNGLVVFLDFHGWYNLKLTDFDRFVAIWTSVATYYKDKYPEDLIFEIINEPHSSSESSDGGDLNLANLVVLETRAIEAIRSVDPDRFICIAPHSWNSIWTLRDSGIDASNMFRNTTLMNYQDAIIAVHSYAPLEFTHQDMSWTGTGGQRYAWTEEYAEQTRQDMAYLVEFVEETGMYVVLNEFGCNTGSSVSDADELAYTSAVIDSIKGNSKISCTWWEYEQSFGMTSNGNWKTHILNKVLEK